MSYPDGRSTRPPPDASSSSSAGSSHVPLPRQTDLSARGNDNYSSSSNTGASGAGGGGPSSVYSSGGAYNNYPPSHSHQQRLPPSQHQQQHQQQQQQQQHHQSSYPSSHASHEQHPHPHSSSYYLHPPHAHQPQPSSSMPYGGYDYQSFPLFPYGYPPQGPSGTPFNVSGSASGQGQGSNGINGGGGGGHGSQHAHHSSTGSTHSNNEDTKPAFSYYGSASSNFGGLSGNGGQDNMDPITVAPLPEHIEAGIMAGDSSWLFQPGALSVGLDINSGSPSTGGTAVGTTTPATAPDINRRPSNPGNAKSSPSAPTQTIGQQHPPSQSNLSNPNNVSASPISSNPTLPSPSAPFGPHSTSTGPAPLPAIVPPMAPPTDPLFLGLPHDGWRLAVEPLTFTSGLEGISGLPLDVFHATTALSELPPPGPPLDTRRQTESLAHDEELHKIDTYLADLITLMEPFAPSPSNPSPNPPPPFLHTRITRLATLVRESLKLLEPRSQPLLDASFILPPPGLEVSEADREMELIRVRRKALTEKQSKAKDIGNPVPRMQGILNVGRPGPHFNTGPRPMRDIWRCSGCGATASSEWLDGPDGPQSLCDSCGYHYARLLRKRPDGGDPDFSSVPALGHNPNLIGLGPT